MTQRACGLLIVITVSVVRCSAQTQRYAVSFGPPVTYRVGNGPASVAIADINGDGKPDIIVANGQSNNVTVLLGDGRGEFRQSRGSPWPAGKSPNDIAIADFDGDNKLDLAFPNHDSKFITVLLGDGKGGFDSAPHSPFTVQSKPHPHGIAAGDLNGDGKPDLVVESWQEDKVEILFGDGKGDFTIPGPMFEVGRMPYYKVRVGDLNNDKKLDIVTTNFEGNSVTILFGNGKGTFTVLGDSAIAVPKSPFGVAIGDVNGDHNPDLAIVHYSGHSTDPSADGLTILLGNGKGKFSIVRGSPLRVGSAPVSVALGDVNGDGILDIATANSGSNDVSIFLGGRKGFTAAPGSPFPVGRNPESIALGDLNNDGRADIVTANFQDDSITLLLSK